MGQNENDASSTFNPHAAGTLNGPRASEMTRGEKSFLRACHLQDSQVTHLANGVKRDLMP